MRYCRTARYSALAERLCGLSDFERVESMVRYIYLRENTVSHKPIGCVAYKYIDDNTFIYGYSIMHPDMDLNKKSGITIPPFLAFLDGGKTVTIKGGRALSVKEAARKIATRRLEMAVQGVERKECRGKYGKVIVSGKRFCDKVAFMLAIIHDHKNTRYRTKCSLSKLIGHLRSTFPVREPQEVVANKATWPSSWAYATDLGGSNSDTPNTHTLGVAS